MRHSDDGAFDFRDVAGDIEVVSRASLEEQDGLGRARLKGALARRLQGEFGAGPVRWSGAVFDGPFHCGSFKVMTMRVDPITIKLGGAQ